MPDSNSIKLCECGCGKPAPIATKTNRKYGHIRGQPVRFICGHHARTHNHSNINGQVSSTYSSWSCMIQRCTNPHARAWHWYGAKGIHICKRWNAFENFLTDMGRRPKGTTLDRYPNNAGNYEPSNCRWATKKQQDNNRTNNVLLTFNGVTQTASQWADEVGIHKNTIYARIRLGWSIEKTLTTKYKGKH